jgi:hypothetical protein
MMDTCTLEKLFSTTAKKQNSNVPLASFPDPLYSLNGATGRTKQQMPDWFFPRSTLLIEQSNWMNLTTTDTQIGKETVWNKPASKPACHIRVHHSQRKILVAPKSCCDFWVSPCSGYSPL